MITGVKQFTNSFSVFVFNPSPGVLARLKRLKEGKIVVAEYAKHPKSFQGTLGKRVAFLMAEIPHLFLPQVPFVPFCSFLIWVLRG